MKETEFSLASGRGDELDPTNLLHKTTGSNIITKKPSDLAGDVVQSIASNLRNINKTSERDIPYGTGQLVKYKDSTVIESNMKPTSNYTQPGNDSVHAPFEGNRFLSSSITDLSYGEPIWDLNDDDNREFSFTGSLMRYCNSGDMSLQAFLQMDTHDQIFNFISTHTKHVEAYDMSGKDGLQVEEIKQLDFKEHFVDGVTRKETSNDTEKVTIPPTSQDRYELPLSIVHAGQTVPSTEGYVITQEGQEDTFLLSLGQRRQGRLVAHNEKQSAIAAYKAQIGSYTLNIAARTNTPNVATSNEVHRQQAGMRHYAQRLEPSTLNGYQLHQPSQQAVLHADEVSHFAPGVRDFYQWEVPIRHNMFSQVQGIMPHGSISNTHGATQQRIDNSSKRKGGSEAEKNMSPLKRPYTSPPQLIIDRGAPSILQLVQRGKPPNFLAQEQAFVPGPVSAMHPASRSPKAAAEPAVTAHDQDPKNDLMVKLLMAELKKEQ